MMTLKNNPLLAALLSRCLQGRWVLLTTALIIYIYSIIRIDPKEGHADWLMMLYSWSGLLLMIAMLIGALCHVFYLVKTRTIFWFIAFLGMYWFFSELQQYLYRNFDFFHALLRFKSV